MPLFQICCTFDCLKKANVAILKTKHLQYVNDNNGFIKYGGVLIDESNEPMGVVYYFFAEEKTLAEFFIKNDPYIEVYDHIDIQLFVQKKPNI